MVEVWPNLYIIGARKGGTTSLHRYLDQHPDIYMSPVKEPYYFDDPKGLWNTDDHDAATVDYLSLYHGVKDELWIGEASSTYLCSSEAPERIKAVSPNAKIIVSLRDPVERLYSHYMMHVRDGVRDAPLPRVLKEETDPAHPRSQAVDNYVQLSHYAQPIQRYIDVFGRDNVLVVMFDDLVKNTPAVLQRIASFLELPPDSMDAIDTRAAYNQYSRPRNRFFKIIRESKTIQMVAQKTLPLHVRSYIGDKVLGTKRKPPIPAPVVTELRARYEPDVEQLEAVLGEPLPALRKIRTP